MTELSRQSRVAAVMPPGPEPLYVQFPRVLLQQQAKAYVFVTGEDWWAVQEPVSEVLAAAAHEEVDFIRCTIAGLGNTVWLRNNRIVAVVEPDPSSGVL